MKFLKALLIVLVLITGTARADSSSVDKLTSGLHVSPELADYLVRNGIVMKNNKYLSFANATPGGTKIPAIRLGTGNNLHVGAISGKVINLENAETPIAKVDGSGVSAQGGFGFNYAAAFVPTLVPTPVATTSANEFKPGLNTIPTNAANNAGFLGPQTPVPGQHFTILNSSGASQRVKAAGGATMNGATAGGYVVIADKAIIECYTASLSNQSCEQPVVPTAAGP